MYAARVLAAAVNVPTFNVLIEDSSTVYRRDLFNDEKRGIAHKFIVCIIYIQFHK